MRITIPSHFHVGPGGVGEKNIVELQSARRLRGPGAFLRERVDDQGFICTGSRCDKHKKNDRW